MDLEKINKTSAIIFMMGLLAVSYIIGVYSGISMTVDRAVRIIPIFANITIDHQTVDDALFRYRNNLGVSQCISISQPKA